MSTLHMTSTTATQEEVNAALGIEPEKPADAGEETETVEQPEKVAAEPEGSGEEDAEQDQPGAKPHKKGGFVRKIEKLTAENEALKTQMQQILDRLEGKSSAQPAKETTSGEEDPEPSDEDPKYKTYREFIRDHEAWAFRQHTKQQRESELQQAVNEEAQSIEAKYQEGVSKFIESHPDFDDVMSDIPMYQGVVDVLKQDPVNGPAVAYHIATHPDVAKKLMEMTPLQAIAEAGRISASLSKGPVAAKPRSSAPAPIKPVGGSSQTTTGSLDNMSLNDYRKLRESGRL